MTSTEWRKFCEIEAAVARIEERLRSHCEYEDSRKARLAPWLSAISAVVAAAVAVFAILHR